MFLSSNLKMIRKIIFVLWFFQKAFVNNCRVIKQNIAITSNVYDTEGKMTEFWLADTKDIFLIFLLFARRSCS